MRSSIARLTFKELSWKTEGLSSKTMPRMLNTNAPTVSASESRSRQLSRTDKMTKECSVSPTLMELNAN